ncbi:YbaN family protein [Xanthobacter oligotrophicus]|uniref:YbaN family protein n=1 Tax=Xanthobacter oligotrophicus TaxID=2607286 RepID=UPI001E47C037|nr:YbaN family protein [Xanthobacter oligotrophicus]MCG5233631.1 YbaN family protein [Xanthobacter oligotrophicus]
MMPDPDTSGAPPPSGLPHHSASEQLAARRWSRAAIYRKLLFAAGIIFLVIGAIGMVVPMLPGTVFLILAAWCFTRSSPRFEAWLLNHRYLGPGVVRWRDTGAIPPVVKLFALASFVGTFTGSWYFGMPVPVLAVLGVMFTLLAVFVASRPNH